MKENLRVINEGLAAFNDHDYPRFLRCFSDDVIFYVPGVREPIRGKEAMRHHEESTFMEIPDLHIAEEQRIAEGDWVFLGWVFTGTAASGPFGGRALQVRGSETFRLRRGKIVERHLYWDRKEVEEQLSGPS